MPPLLLCLSPLVKDALWELPVVTSFSLSHFPCLNLSLHKLRCHSPSPTRISRSESSKSVPSVSLIFVSPSIIHVSCLSVKNLDCCWLKTLVRKSPFNCFMKPLSPTSRSLQLRSPLLRVMSHLVVSPQKSSIHRDIWDWSIG